MAQPRIGIIGGGVGGLTAAIALKRIGMEAFIYEQAAEFRRIGADINLTPNAVRALDGLGLGPELRTVSARPTHRVSRMWDTGVETSRLAMSDEAELRYHAPQLTFHRADLLAILESHVPNGTLFLGMKAHEVASSEAAASVRFTDGSSADFDMLIGADGIHSTVRARLFGEESPQFTGIVAYRAIVSRDKLVLSGLDAFTKWWGPNPETQIIAFPLNQGKEIFVFATTVQPEWRHESWSQPGSVEELRQIYKDFHPEARVLLDACDNVLKTALYSREPLEKWAVGRIALLGDSCHPMMPFMAQGAAMATEDAVVLARCMERDPNFDQCFNHYQRARIPRASDIQIKSRRNDWLRQGSDADWVYAYDAWGVPLD